MQFDKVFAVWCAAEGNGVKKGSGGWWRFGRDAHNSDPPDYNIVNHYHWHYHSHVYTQQFGRAYLVNFPASKQDRCICNNARSDYSTGSAPTSYAYVQRPILARTLDARLVKQCFCGPAGNAGMPSMLHNSPVTLITTILQFLGHTNVRFPFHT